MADDRAPAVVLLSGGLDSATVLAIAKADGFRTYALTLAYGQRHAAEIAAAKRIAERNGVERHVVLDLDLTVFGGSALTAGIAVPKGRTRAAMEASIPVTYVPARNTIFLSLALAFAETLGALDIFIGVNAVDYSGYPDCRPEYIRAFEAMARLATKSAVESGKGVRLHAPLISLSKAEIIRRGLRLGVDFGATVSCYDPGPRGEPCRACDACGIRAEGFAEAGLGDPAIAAPAPADQK